MKWIVFGPIIVFFGFFAILVIGFLALVTKLVISGKNSSWQGKIIDKKLITRRDSDTNLMKYYYSFVIKPNTGRDIKIAVAKEMYDKCKIGDEMKKEKGKLYPEKI